MDEGEVVDDVLAPVGEVASLKAIATEAEGLGVSIGTHSGEVTPPTESVGPKHASDRADTAIIDWSHQIISAV
jgi:hypothetical protein